MLSHLATVRTECLLYQMVVHVPVRHQIVLHVISVHTTVHHRQSHELHHAFHRRRVFLVFSPEETGIGRIKKPCYLFVNQTFS